MEQKMIPSSTGLCNINLRFWKPADKAPRAVLTIMHGMAEHVDRYDAFAGFLNQNGIAVAAADMASHGKSISENGIRGYFGEENGWEHLVEDACNVHQVIKEAYPSIPCFLLGHSMGSFLARSYAARHGEDIAAFIFCGTAGKNPIMPIAKLFAKNEIKRIGPSTPSRKLDSMAFGAYSKPFERRTAFDWLSADKENVDRYVADPLCGFTFTAAAFLDLFTGLDEVSKSDWASKVPDKPIFVIAGDKDPVGNMGKGPREVAAKLTATGHDVTFKLYPGMRHEILNETGKEAVWQDVLGFLNMSLG